MRDRPLAGQRCSPSGGVSLAGAKLLFGPSPSSPAVLLSPGSTALAAISLRPRQVSLPALLLSTSVFFLAYMIHARSFTLVSLFTTLSIWSYWRMVLHPASHQAGPAQAGLVLGSASLLYMHYFCALFLPVLGLFHLIFVPRNRRWWQTVYLLVLAALLAMLQLPGFLQGLNEAAIKESLRNRALEAPALVSHFVRNLTNGLLNPSPPLNELLLISLLLTLTLVVLLHLRSVIPDQFTLATCLYVPDRACCNDRHQ